MQATLAELAALVKGTCVGDERLVVTGAAPLCDAGAGDITLLDGGERCQQVTTCSAVAAICPSGFRLNDLPVIEVANVHDAFSAIVRLFRPQPAAQRIGVSPQAAVSATARLADDVDVHPFASIGDGVTIGAGSTIHSGVRIMAGSQIGQGVTIFPNAVLYENTIVGNRCILHANVVLGAYGFGYSFVDGRHVLTSQLGNVVIGDDVEIGANATVDRGTYGPTVVGAGTKIDNMVMIAHNCHIGRHNMLCSQVGIAGSTSTGDYVVMAGQVGVRDHVHIGDRAVLGAMAGVINDVPAGQRYIGIPATPERDQKIKQAVFSKLPDMRRDLKSLQASVSRLIDEMRSAELESMPTGEAKRRAVA
jgi:UDP-3-O-[3-hydroxymyristoyl] glucosamine N-acyltransferase